MAWMLTNKTWHDTDVDYCDVCGNLLINRYWAFTTLDGTELRACREEDERLHGQLLRFAPLIEEARRAWDANVDTGRSGAPDVEVA